MPTEPTMQTARSSTIAAVACAGIVGACVAAGACKMMGGDQTVTMTAAVVALVSALPGLLPATLETGTVQIAKWGMLAFVGTLLLPMVGGVVGFILDATRNLDWATADATNSRDRFRTAYWMSCFAGAMAVLATQVAWVIRTLSRGQRLWDGSRASTEAA